MSMAKSRSGSFYLTETVTLAAADPSGTRVQGVIDLGAYVSVIDGIAIAVESCDFLYQWASAYNGAGAGMLAGNGGITCQLTDLNPGTVFVRADDQSLIASGTLNIDDANNITSQSTDLYPDNFGPASLSEAYLVVNDSMYVVGGVNNAAVGGSALFITARLKVRAVSLNKSDWIAIAIQSVASDA
jgi:hypothetical protein